MVTEAHLVQPAALIDEEDMNCTEQINYVGAQLLEAFFIEKGAQSTTLKRPEMMWQSKVKFQGGFCFFGGGWRTS